MESYVYPAGRGAVAQETALGQFRSLATESFVPVSELTGPRRCASSSSPNWQLRAQLGGELADQDDALTGSR